jgi:hypothetical protein
MPANVPAAVRKRRYGSVHDMKKYERASVI